MGRIGEFLSRRLFTADINLGLIRYVLHQENVEETMDNFKFLVKDSKPNVVSDNVFHIQWSLISFEHKRSVPCAPLHPLQPFADISLTSCTFAPAATT